MGSLLAYSGVSTKVRAMERKLLKWSDYEALSQMTNLHDAVSYLKSLPGYSATFDVPAENRLNREFVEKLIMRSLYFDYQKIYKFCNPKQRSFLQLYFKRFEIEVLKYFLRNIFNSHKQSFYITTRKEFFQKYSKLDLEALFACNNVLSLVQVLEGTEYFSLLNHLNQREDSTLRDYEIALDLYYFSVFWKQKNKLFSGKDLKAITKDYGVQIDMLNIQWAYRAKKYYNLRAGDIYAMAIPIHYKLKKEQFMGLAQAESAEEVVDLLKHTYYGSKYTQVIQGDIENTYYKILNRIYRLDVRQNPYSMVAIHTYLYQKEREIDTLTTVLECIRYKLDSGETLKLIRGENE